MEIYIGGYRIPLKPVAAGDRVFEQRTRLPEGEWRPAGEIPKEVCGFCGGKRVQTLRALSGDRGYACEACGIQTWDKGLAG